VTETDRATKWVERQTGKQEKKKENEEEREEDEEEGERGSGRISSGSNLARLRGSVNECAEVDLGRSEPPLDDVYPSPYMRRIIAAAC
jgi:hypothetical protein